MSYSNQNQLVIAIFLASSVIYFVHVFLFPLYDTTPQLQVNLRSLLTLEKSLCKSNLKNLKVPLSWRKHCPKDGFVTVAQGGRLGNQIWEYASVWAVARKTGLEPFVPRCILHSLGDIFDKLSVPPLAYIGHCQTRWGSIVNDVDLWNDSSQSILLPRYAILPEQVLTWVEDVRRELNFKPSLREQSQRMLRNISTKHYTSGVTFVAIHVRRTDYKDYLMRTRHSHLATASYFLRGMEYYEEKYKTVEFIVVSDDPVWCRKNIASKRNNVHVLSRPNSNSAGLDLALMAACNHTIIDYGTFGVWGAILSGGETILYNISHHSSLRVGELLQGWQVIS